MFTTTFFYTAAVAVNICLCHDLIYCLRDPMRNPEGRYLIYFIFVTITATATGLTRVCSWKQGIYGFMIQFMFFVYLIIAVASIIFAYRFVRKPGISQEARSLIVRIHITYIVVNIVCQMYSIVSKAMVPIEFNKTLKEESIESSEFNYDSWYFVMMATFFFGQGLFLTLVRIMEPGYVETILFNIKFKICAKRIRRKVAENEEEFWAPIEKIANEFAALEDSMVNDSQIVMEVNSSEESEEDLTK